MLAIHVTSSTIAHAARLAWPWLTLYAVSGVLAFGLDQGLTHTPTDDGFVHTGAVRRSQLVLTSEPSQTTSEAERGIWITLSAANGTGGRVSVACIATPEMFSSDTLEVDPADLKRLSAQLQCQTSAP